ncbi:MAG: 2-hydroxyacyl-CoA dehydratase [Dehalococcoidia bacterium]|nr:2-hydroxyacyl-CoA dehydratase [Dehalococcoidia bacterium]
MSEDSRGLARARDIYDNREQRAKEFKQGGKKVVGYMCIYPPLEMLTALDLVPYRVFGDMREAITEADRGLPVAFCPFVRSCLDLGMKGEFGFLDGMVATHSCDAIEKTAHVWEHAVSHPYFHFIEIPTKVNARAEEVFKGELEAFKKTLEAFAEHELTSEKLKKAIGIHNEQRALVRELYGLRKADPPVISGSETLVVLKALMSVPADEGNELLKEVLAEVKARENPLKKDAPRLLVWGSIVDDVSLIELIENAGSNVVVDDTCVGSRAFWKDVRVTDDPLDGLAHHYLADIKCARTFFEAEGSDRGEATKDYALDLESRFGYLKEMAEGWHVDGVILQSVKYCDTHGFDVPDVRNYVTSLGLPSTYLEHDYTEGSLAPLKTRVQGFLEMIG